MKTFLSWLIANLEIAGVVILLPFIWMFLRSHPEYVMDGKPMWMMFVVYSLTIAALGSTPTTGFFGDLINLLLSIIGGIVLVILTHSGATPSVMITHMIICGVIGTAIGVATAFFAVANFYEVVSLRWTYVNSNAEKFEASALYGFSRFCIGFHIGVFAYALLL